MRRIGGVLFGMGLGLAVLSPSAATPPVSSSDQKTAQVIWTGQSGGFAMRWTTGDLEARPLAPPGRLAFSARSPAPKELLVDSH